MESTEVQPALPARSGIERTAAGRALVFAYIALVTVAGAAMAASAVVLGPHLEILPIVLFCAAAGAAEWLKVATDESPVAISLSLTIIVATMITFGAGGATLAGISAVVVPAIFRRQRPPLRKILFNAGLFSLCAGCAALTYAALGGRIGGSIRVVDLVVAMVAATVYFLVNWPLLVIVVRLTTGRSVRAIWSEDLRWTPVQIVVGAALGFALGASYRLLGWVGAAIYLAPLLAIRESMRLYTSRVHQANAQLTEANRTLDMTNEGLLKTLAAVIDARDVFLYGHSLQASKYAGEVARKLGLSRDEIRTAELGALLHDIGKIGIRDSLLNKPARLTPSEYHEVKAHSQIGYELLSNLPGFEGVADVVRSHHERYDGQGYPRGLRGVQIPVAARIVSVVEAVEAMVSDRPYRKGMTPDEVLTELARGAGSQWDADVVAVFSSILSKDRKHLVMRNSALEIALNRAPLRELLSRDRVVAADPGLRDITTTFSTAAQPIFILDNDYRIVSINPTAERLTGYPTAAVEGREWSELCAAQELRRGIPQTFFGNTRHVTLTAANGSTVELEVTGTPLRTSSATYWLVLAHDVSDRVRVESELKRQARTDFLTDLATRKGIEERAIEAMQLGEEITMVMLDLNGLKGINDSLGHATGDDALRAFGGVLSKQLRETDLAARFGGDEFAVMLVGSAGDAARTLVERISKAVEHPLPELGFAIDFCFGIAQWDRRESLAELIGRADSALYDQKHSRIEGKHERIVLLPKQRTGA